MAKKLQTSPHEAQAHNELHELRSLIAWIAPRIVRRNANGAPGDKFCLLCLMGIPEFKRLPCRHQEIWEAAGKIAMENE